MKAAYKARRARHGTQQRSVLFPSTNYGRPSRLRQKQKMKSAAIIEDSDDLASEPESAVRDPNHISRSASPAVP
jgi:hypothetical protein